MRTLYSASSFLQHIGHPIMRVRCATRSDTSLIIAAFTINDNFIVLIDSLDALNDMMTRSSHLMLSGGIGASCKSTVITRVLVMKNMFSDPRGLPFESSRADNHKCFSPEHFKEAPNITRDALNQGDCTDLFSGLSMPIGSHDNELALSD